MGFFDNLTGGKSRDDVNRAANQANALLGQGYEGAKGYYGTAFTDAKGYFQPYADQGARANALYNDALGLNGADRRQAFMAQYMNDPFLTHDRDQAVQSVARRFNASGNFGGAAQLAGARAAMDAGNQYRESYLNRLAGLQGQGLGVAQTLAGLTSQYGSDMAGLEYGYRNQLAGNEINRGNALASTRSAGINNLLNALGVGAKVVSAFGEKR